VEERVREPAVERKNKREKSKEEEMEGEHA